ncbi:hypothetical protein B5C34_15635 [Pacificimonas flava]|uniref:RND efflux pump membrane fusion protein barrel-sandwich domain-containing protein n=2 Tax=Pacificimonas TaxID=1960290 RepID=A0A219B0S9_9SPHN|nr:MULTISPECIES: efflux RND transporter periplasmic adaptor subunit [Pacificimonas]MBZ6379603.1 efflux RND transporter periplasmic adaptor subunit [Pacificimonas aurantium]OWV31925.1 hypothetical protein B5C34_15635 [Pacificimonas flava]
MTPVARAATCAALLFLASCGNGEEADQSDAADSQTPSVTVRVAEAEEQDVQSWVYAQGTARAIQREFLTFESAGRVEYVNPDVRVGQRVRKGTLLAYQQPDRPRAALANAQAGLAGARGELAVAEANLDEANANLELALETFQRYEILLAQNSASQQEYDEAEARLAQARAAREKAAAQLQAVRAEVGAARARIDEAEVTVSESRIVAPIDGVLARLNLEQGRYFTPQQVQTQSEAGALSTIPALVIDPSTYEITVELPSYQFSNVAVGRTVLIRSSETGPNASVPTGARPNVNGRSSPGLPVSDYQIRGVVYSVTPALDPQRRTFEVVIRTTTGEDTLQDGEFVTVWIEGIRSDSAVTIPLEALLYEDDEPYVFVVDRETMRASREEVTVGLRASTAVAVTEGVAAGAQVVVRGTSELQDGDRVRLEGERETAASQRTDPDGGDEGAGER